MTTDTVNLAKCVCGDIGRLREFHKNATTPEYDVSCDRWTCPSHTPNMKTAELAVAAWNRMMEPWTEQLLKHPVDSSPQFQQAMEKVFSENAGLLGGLKDAPPSDARSLLWALADELESESKNGVNFWVMQDIQKAIRAVLSKK